MQIHCCYTPAHAVLFEEYFRPSLPDGMTLHSTTLAITGEGDFRGEDYMTCLRQKIELIAESVESNSGEILVWSDVDVLFFRPVVAELRALFESGEDDILYQRESRDPRFGINGGFLACRCSARAANFYRLVREEMERHPCEHDQDVINRLLNSQISLPARIGLLPLTYSARTHGWPPPREARLYHANYTRGPGGVAQKIVQFAQAQRAIRGSHWQRCGTILRAALGCLPRKLFSTVLRRAGLR